jgi:hypothetical protein
MNRRLIMSLVLGGTLGLCSGVAWSQQAPPPPPPGTEMMHGGPGGGWMAPPIGERIELLGFEGMHGGKVVTGAPFSAVAVSVSTQTLSDGNQITRKTQTNLFRDSQGRFRKEVNFSAIGTVAEAGQPRTFIVIHDPVAQVGYALQPDQKVAHKMPFAGNKRASNPNAESRFESRMQKELANGTLKKEDLGTQTINGVVATGTRYTHTIAAGQIGNEKPISVVSEQWYSTELQMVVKSTRTDPRSGTTTYTVTSIQRSEPAASLFAVPSDYSVTEGGPSGGHAHGGARQAPPTNPQ